MNENKDFTAAGYLVIFPNISELELRKNLKEYK